MDLKFLEIIFVPFSEKVTFNNENSLVDDSKIKKDVSEKSSEKNVVAGARAGGGQGNDVLLNNVEQTLGKVRQIAFSNVRDARQRRHATTNRRSKTPVRKGRSLDQV